MSVPAAVGLDLGTLASSTAVMASKNSRCTTKPTSTAVAALCWTFVPSSGKTAGRSPAITSRKVITRFNPPEPGPPWNWPCKVCRSVVHAAVEAAHVAARRVEHPADAEVGAAPVPAQDAAAVSKDWPTGNIDVRLANYLIQAQQKWNVAPAPDAGGYLGSPFFKITIAGTDRASRDQGRRAHHSPVFHRRLRAAVADRSALRRHLPDYAEGHS